MYSEKKTLNKVTRLCKTEKKNFDICFTVTDAEPDFLPLKYKSNPSCWRPNVLCKTTGVVLDTHGRQMISDRSQVKVHWTREAPGADPKSRNVSGNSPESNSPCVKCQRQYLHLHFCNDGHYCWHPRKFSYSSCLMYSQWTPRRVFSNLDGVCKRISLQPAGKDRLHWHFKVCAPFHS